MIIMRISLIFSCSKLASTRRATQRKRPGLHHGHLQCVRSLSKYSIWSIELSTLFVSFEVGPFVDRKRKSLRVEILPLYQEQAATCHLVTEVRNPWLRVPILATFPNSRRKAHAHAMVDSYYLPLPQLFPSAICPEYGQCQSISTLLQIAVH